MRRGRRPGRIGEQRLPRPRAARSGLSVAAEQSGRQPGLGRGKWCLGEVPGWGRGPSRVKDSSHRDRTTWLLQRVRGEVGGPDPARRPHGLDGDWNLSETSGKPRGESSGSGWYGPLSWSVARQTGECGGWGQAEVAPPGHEKQDPRRVEPRSAGHLIRTLPLLDWFQPFPVHVEA